MHLERINNLSGSELDQVATLHYRVLEESFLNNFGLDFLKITYNALAQDSSNIVVLAQESAKVVGFGVAALDGDTLSQRVMQTEYPKLFWEILKSAALKPEVLARLVQWRLSPTQEHAIKPELQFLAVEKPRQRQGIGTSIVGKLAEEFDQYGITQYRVGTKAQNPISNSFYRKLGFTFLNHEQIFGDLFNYYLS